MWVDYDKWIHWEDQCKYCKNINNCEYHGCMKEYIHRLKQVKVNPPVYGSLSFVCDYFYFDEKKYKNRNLRNCDG